MLEMGDVFDKLAFQGISTKDLVAMVATNVWDGKNRGRKSSPFTFWPTRQEVEHHVAEIVARYGKIGRMTRKNFVNAVWDEMVRRERRKAKNDGMDLYFFK
jgi:hypothetical protein